MPHGYNETVMVLNSHIMIKGMFMLARPVRRIKLASSCGSNHEEEEETKFIVTSPWKKTTITRIRLPDHAIQHRDAGFGKATCKNIYVDEGQSVKKDR